MRLLSVPSPEADQKSTRAMLKSSMPKIITQMTSSERRLCRCAAARNSGFTSGVMMKKSCMALSMAYPPAPENDKLIHMTLY